MSNTCQSPATNRGTVTLVVPVYNEAGNIAALVREVMEAAAGIPDWTVELLFVDDGSRDETAAALNALRDSGVPVGCLRLSRNFGHQAALEAGLFAAAGDVVITLDGDLQHPPSEIARMLAAHQQGADVVHMVRSRPANGRKGTGSRIFYRLFSRMAHADIVPDAADFRLVSRRVVEVLKRIPERQKFLRGLIPTLGFSQTVLTFEEQERHAGRPAYTFRKSFRLARKAFFDFSTVPLQLVFWMGTLLAAISFLTGLGHVLNKLLNGADVTPGFTDVITAILFLCGCILAALGILGRYMIMILDQVRGRPPYVVADLTPPAPLRAPLVAVPEESRPKP